MQKAEMARTVAQVHDGQDILDTQAL